MTYNKDANGGCSHSYFGLVNTLTDAHLLLEAARIGIVPRVSRRLTDAEKVKYVKPGAVFLWEEEESGMLRWTDHYRWSPSRVSGSFLLYSAIDLPQSIHVDDTLIKQSFFSVDASGARFHLIAYSSRNFRLGAGLHAAVSEDPKLSQLAGSNCNTSVPLPLRPRVVSTSHCFALVRTAPTQPPALLPPMSNFPSTSRPSSSASSNSEGYHSIPLHALYHKSSAPSLRIEDPKRKQSLPLPVRQPLAAPISSPPPPPPLSAFRPLPLPLPLPLYPAPSSIHSLVNNPPNTYSIKLPSFSSIQMTTLGDRKQQTRKVSPTSSTNSSTSSRSRSLEPLTPTTSMSTSPPLTPFKSTFSNNHTSSHGGSRYRPYSPDSRMRIASLSSHNLERIRTIPPMLHRSASFDSSFSRGDNDSSRRSYRGGVAARDPEDVRVLSLLGRFSMAS